MKILFVNPIVREEENPKHIPYGMAILVQLAVDAGYDIQVYDENAHRPHDPVKTLNDVLNADDWDVVCAGGLITTYSGLKRIFKLSTELVPNALRIIGGGALTSIPRDIMRLIPADIGIVGEAFKTFPTILELYKSGKLEYEKIKGIAYRGANGKIIINAPVDLVQNLDSIPYPAIDYFPLEIYFKNSSLILSEEALTSKRRIDINGSFGCNLICRFCWHLGTAGEMNYINHGDGEVVFSYTRTVRKHSPKYIVDMVKHLREKHQIDFVQFLDENLMTVNADSGYKWLPELCELWIEEGLQPSCVKNNIPHDESCQGVHWGGTSHAGLINSDKGKELLKLCKKSGCSNLDYGLESFNDRVLKNIGKGSTCKSNINAIKYTMEAGIRPIPNQIIGFPDEFFDSIYDDMDAWKRLGIVVYPFFATAYPGSEWFTIYKEKILSQYDGDIEKYLIDLGDATKITGVISENFTAVELLGIRELMVKFNYKKIREYEGAWWEKNKCVKLPYFHGSGWRKRLKKLKDDGSGDLYSVELRRFNIEEYKEEYQQV